MVTLYIGGLEPRTTENELAQLFGDFGEVPHMRVVTNDDGHCRGFAYVSFSNDLAAARARVALNGRELHGNKLRVAKAT
jgi:RNA recognition motif-containing protein